MKMILLPIVLVPILFLIGCKKDALPVELSNICAADNEKKYVVTSGFFKDRGSIFCSNIGGGRMDCGVDVAANPGGAKIFGADIEQGSGANQIEKFPGSYKPEDVKIHDSKGNLIAMSDKVILTGQMSILPDGSVCFMTVDKIEK